MKLLLHPTPPRLRLCPAQYKNNGCARVSFPGVSLVTFVLRLRPVFCKISMEETAAAAHASRMNLAMAASTAASRECYDAESESLCAVASSASTRARC